MAGEHDKAIIRRRCDEPMRRSKETPKGLEPKFRCSGKCKECICCIEQDANGLETHVNLMDKARKRGDISD